MTYTVHPLMEQGSPEWFAMRKGRITGSRFKDARDRTAKGLPSAKCKLYALDVARERCGGKAGDKFQTSAMRFGSEQEPLARTAYEKATGNVVFEVGFITDDTGFFGLSPDGTVDDDGVVEIKTMVSSDTLFTAMVEGDISAYLDQCMGYLWMLNRKWVDLVLWAPDLADMGLGMKIIRIERDEAAIEALESDLLAFMAVVRESESKLRKAAIAANAELIQEAA
jgi:exodeoxyribonuclease (lambda-induced)